MIERDLQTLEDVGTGFGLAQLEFGAPAHDLAAELEEVLDDVNERQHARPAADDRQHDDAERGLQLRVLVEVIENDLRHFAALELDDDAHAVAVGLVTQIGDAVDHLLADELGDVLEQPLLVDLIGNLGDDNRDLVALLRFLGRRLRPDGERAPASRIGVENAVPADDRAAGGEIRAGNGLQHRLEAGFFRLAAMLDQVAMTPSITSRMLCGGMLVAMPTAMPDDPLTSRFGIGRRKDGRFFGRLVEVGNEVDRLLVEIAHHLFGERLEPGFGVAVGGRRIAVDRAKVPLAVDQDVPHVEVLRQADERVVRRRVAVRMVVADHLADDLRAFAVGTVRRQSHLPHRIQHAAMRRLQAVAHVRQRAPDDYAHRVIHVRALHLVFDVDGELVQGVGHRVIVSRLAVRGWLLVTRLRRCAWVARSKAPSREKRAARRGARYRGS